MRCVVLLMVCNFLFFNAMGQSEPVKVLVKDRVTSLPVRDVNVFGQSISTKTDKDGYFILGCDLPKSDSITFRHLNYKKTGRSVASLLKNRVVQLDGSTTLIEPIVVHTGYQRVEKQLSSGAVDKIDLKQIRDIYGVNIMQKLEGNSAILFDKSSNKRSMTIRGLSSINNSNLPLIVLDNFPYEGNIDWINPNDIEDISILKDASASAIWGARAGNGVIVITTKKGAYNKANKIEFNSAFQMQDKPDLHYLNQISSSSIVDLERFLFEKGYYKNWETSSDKPFISPVVEHLIAIRDKNGNAEDHEKAIDRLRSLDVRDDYGRYMYRTSVNQNHNIGLSGGGKDIRYQLTARMDNNVGELSTERIKSMARSFIEIAVHPNIKLSSDLQYANDKMKRGKSAYSLIGTKPYLMLADENGSPLPHAPYRVSYLDTVGGGLLKDWSRYPLVEHERQNMQNGSGMLLANISGDIKLIRGFDLQANYRYERTSEDNSSMYDENSFVLRDLVNRYSVVDYQRNTVKYGVPGEGMIDQSFNLQSTHNFRIGIAYNTEWRGFLTSIIAGSEWRNTETETAYNRLYGYDTDTRSTVKVDYVNAYRHLVNKSNIYVPYVDGKSRRVNRFLSQYANASVSYESKYVLTGSLRRDASNLFGVKTNDRWQPLWSIGYKWNLSKEAFFTNTLVEQLSLRGSYGVSGNVDQSRSAITTIKYMNTDYFTNLPKAIISQFSNPDLRWEKNTTWNTGIDFSLLSGRVYGSVDYYVKWGDDLFGTAPVDFTAIPSKAVMRNVAAMKSSGLDINLNANVPLTTRIFFRPQFMLNLNRSKVTDYYLSGTYAYQLLSQGSSVNGIIGQPVYSILAYRWRGLDEQGNPLGELNGKPSIDYRNIRNQDKSSLDYMGTVVPKISGYLNPAFTYGNFDLSIGFLYKIGHVFKRTPVRYGELVSMNGLGVGSGDYENRWMKAGDEYLTDVPSFVYPANTFRNAFYENSSVLIEKASHIRLQNIVMGYHFQVKGKYEVKIFGNATNLGIVWKSNKRGIDPDYVSTLRPEKLLSIGIRVNY